MSYKILISVLAVINAIIVIGVLLGELTVY
ncbi:hypothetical protein J2S17_003564 [Cytobacillus purgationiresistens]|uniref:Uncharacterized protein n=1 Tax=Cytobacillus purgationiresistens TaxID=863449 RepID=A0ABU0AK77_9BACI|nr:hypothetical protein [Cytobacillus purgationiresistens]